MSQAVLSQKVLFAREKLAAFNAALAALDVDSLTISKSSAVVTATNLNLAKVKQTLTAASAVNTIEAVQAQVESNVQLGDWANAIAAKIDFKTVGHVTGLAGVVCAELDMPGGTIPGGKGTYTCFEAEINMPTNFVGGGVPVSAFAVNIWGAQKAQFHTSGLLFDINCEAAATTKFFQANTAAAASHALKCRINGSLYYLMLTSTGA